MNHYRRKIREDEWLDIGSRAKAGESQVAIARDYGVSRERIRQIAGLVNPGYSSRTAHDDEVKPLVDEIIRRRFWFEGPGSIFEGYLFTRRNFESYLKRKDHDKWQEWQEALARPYSQFANEFGRICRGPCKQYKTWDKFYRSKGKQKEPNGRGKHCAECTKARVTAYYAAKEPVLVPTVTEKNCPGCGKTKTADLFYRATKQNSGLQTYCKSCQSK